ncbi:MAG TPA: hypothetical protein VFC07_02800, partial [Verrucomicrobiae bacterium]|nr:hypothetical protein [Verrucomicrobiae bacterium]
VAALPYVIGSNEQQPNGAPTGPESILREAQRLVSSMNPSNWKTKQSELLSLLTIDGETNTP